jgi:hypothetical protein
MGASVTHRELIDLIATPGLTAAEQSRLTAPYTGLWLEIEGTIADVHGDNTYAQIHIAREMNHHGLFDAIAAFEKGPESERASALRKGMRIRVTGKIRRISTPWGIELEHSELLVRPV